MRRLFTRLWEWVARCWRREPNPFRTVLVEELPDRLDAGVVYVAGEGRHRWFVAMVCPCGCGATLHMSVQLGTSPCWSLLEHQDGTASLSPSVWRKIGCKSHFFLRRGKVVWTN